LPADTHAGAGAQIPDIWTNLNNFSDDLVANNQRRARTAAPASNPGEIAPAQSTMCDVHKNLIFAKFAHGNGGWNQRSRRWVGGESANVHGNSAG
jgi:hypothetical protein